MRCAAGAARRGGPVGGIMGVLSCARRQIAIGLAASLVLAFASACSDDGNGPDSRTTDTVPPDTVTMRKNAVVRQQAHQPWPNPNSSDPRTAEIGMIAHAFASYIEGDAATANRLVDDLYESEYPPIVGMNTEWSGGLFSTVFLRMYVISQRARSRMGTQQQQRVEQMISEIVDRTCARSEATADPWHAEGSENQLVVRKTNCLLGTYVLSHPDYSDWRDHLVRWLQERAQAGLHDEVNSQYERYTVASIYNLADFPGDETIRRLAKQYLDLFWHDTAHEFNAKTGVQGASGSRMYQPDADGHGGTTYQNPAHQWTREWLYMYAWHNEAPTAATNPALLNAATSTYVPLEISRDLALMDEKDFAYSSRQPGRAIVDAGEGHAIRRDVTVNNDYMLGASTYEPGVDRSISASENRWFGVSINHAPSDRIIVSGLANEKFGSGNFADFYAINGLADDDVIIAARDHDAENSRGVRIYIGEGELRSQFHRDPSGWMFTRAGNAYVAIRVAGPVHVLTDERGNPSSILLSGPADVWMPLVVQMGRESDFENFEQFETDVLKLPYEYAGGTVAFTALNGHKYTMSRQDVRPSLPRIDGREPNTNPPFAYDSPYLHMEWPSTTATLRGPDGTTVTLDFST
jgi:hypothetical protein